MNEQPGDVHGDGDPPELERVVDVLRSAWTEVPDADRASIWSAIEGHLGPQDDPGRDPRPGFLRGVLGGLFAGNGIRQLALAGTAVAIVGTAVVIVGAVLLSGVLQSGPSASAAVLEAVSRLSDTATEALNDNSLSSDELVSLRARATRLLEEVEDNQEGLRGLSAEELIGVIDTLELLIVLLDPHGAGDLDDDFVAIVSSIRQSSDAARGIYAEFEDDGGIEDDDDGPPAAATTSGGGGDDPTATPAATSTPDAASTPDATETPEAEGTPESGETPEPEDTPEPGETPESEDAPEAGESATPSPTATPQATSTPSPTESPTAAPTATATSVPPGESTELIAAVAGLYQLAAHGAGTVSFNLQGETLTVTDVATADGWSASIEEAAGSEIRVRFSSGLDRVLLEVERQDANLEVTVRWWSVAGNG